jgi:hypothetical protein
VGDYHCLIENFAEEKNVSSSPEAINNGSRDIGFTVAFASYG